MLLNWEGSSLLSMLSQYSFWGLIKLLYWIIKTKFICVEARLIRFPFYIRGHKYIDLGYKLTTGVGCRFEAFNISGDKDCKIVFGKNVQVNDYVHIAAMQQVSIGDNVLMASHIYISDNSHGCYMGSDDDTSPLIPPIKRAYYTSPVSIGDNVWIGEGVIILPGVTIGRGAVIGAHSVVNTDIPENCIAVGAPASVIKKYDSERNIWYKVDAMYK